LFRIGERPRERREMGGMEGGGKWGERGALHTGKRNG